MEQNQKINNHYIYHLSGNGILGSQNIQVLLLVKLLPSALGRLSVPHYQDNLLQAHLPKS